MVAPALYVRLMNAESHDSELADFVADAQSGESAALERLPERHLPNLEAFVRVRADTLLIERESIHDVVQSVCREALADIHSIEYRGDAAFRSWLYLLASRKIIDRYRSHRRQRRDVAREVDGGTTESTRVLERFGTTLTPSRVASAQEEARRIESALQRSLSRSAMP